MARGCRPAFAGSLTLICHSNVPECLTGDGGAPGNVDLATVAVCRRWRPRRPGKWLPELKHQPRRSKAGPAALGADARHRNEANAEKLVSQTPGFLIEHKITEASVQRRR